MGRSSGAVFCDSTPDGFGASDCFGDPPFRAVKLDMVAQKGTSRSVSDSVRVAGYAQSRELWEDEAPADANHSAQVRQSWLLVAVVCCADQNALARNVC